MIAFSSLAPAGECVCPWTYIAGVVLHAVVIQVPWQAACVTTTTTLSTVYGVLIGCAHASGGRIGGGGAGVGANGGIVPLVTTVPVTCLTLLSVGVTDAGRPSCHVSDPSFPLHARASSVSDAGPLGFHAPGMQNVNPDARTWRQDESAAPPPETAHGAKATG